MCADSRTQNADWKLLLPVVTACYLWDLLVREKRCWRAGCQEYYRPSRLKMRWNRLRLPLSAAAGLIRRFGDAFRFARRITVVPALLLPVAVARRGREKFLSPI